MHLEENPIPPSEYVPDIPAALEEIVMKVLSKEPAARYRTADQLGRVLMTFGQAQKSAAVRLTQPQPPTIETPAPTASTRPHHATTPRPVPIEEPEPVEDPLASLDWISIGLGLVALAAVGGLFPWWFYVIGTLFSSR